MRFMELIRKKGGTCLGVFLGVFLVSVFAGLGISGGFSFRGCSAEKPMDQVRVVSPQLVKEGPLEKAVMTVNGEPVSEKSYNNKLTILTRGRSYTDNPSMELQAYGYASGYAISEAIIAAEGERLEVKVTAEDLQEAKNEIIDAQMAGVANNSSGNVLGDVAKRIDQSRLRKKTFTDYLASQQMSEEMWEEQARLELFQTKTQESWQEVIDADAARKAEETKAIIDQRLEEGASFEELALEFSQDQNAEGAESIEPFWLSRGLVLKDQEEAAFNAEDGTVTDWIEVPAGWHRFEVLEHKYAEGEEFEAERENIITTLKASSDDEDYEPTDEQIARKYEQVRVRQLMLKTSEPGAVNRKINEAVESADIEINNPYILAYQALYNTKLQPPHSMGLPELQQIAELAPVGEGYDFNLIQEYLDAGVPAVEDEAAAAAEEPATDEEAAEAEDAEAVATDEEPVVEDEEEEELPKCYAMAVGLLITGLQDLDEKDRTTYFHYFIVGQTILDWLADEDAHDRQPLDRDAAREMVEEYMARAAERYEYSAPIHASRGLNLAWLGQEAEALESLGLAEKYASTDATDPVFEDIRKGYEILDATEKLEALDEVLAGYRQEQLQRMIEQAQQQQGDGGIGNSNIVTIPEGGDVEGAIEDAQEEGGGWVKLPEGEEGAGETGEATGEESGATAEETTEPAGDEAGE